MPLDVGLVTALLIEYDSEHPATLGEMADRRSIYAKRLADMADRTEVVVNKIVTKIGGGESPIYRVDHPFGLEDIVAHIYVTSSGEKLMHLPTKEDGYVLYGFTRVLNPEELTVVILG